MTFLDATWIIANCQDNKGKESTEPFRKKENNNKLLAMIFQIA